MNRSEIHPAPVGESIPRRAVHPVPEVAALLGGVTERYVWALIARDELKSVKIGKRRLVPRESIDAFIAELQEDERLARAAAEASS